MNVPETFFNVSDELKLFLMSCILGTALGLFYDIFRSMRLLFRHPPALTAAEDISFCLLWGISLTAFASAIALGRLRGFMFIGSILGFVLYIVSMGRIVTGFMKKLLSLLQSLFSFIFSPLNKCYALIRTKAVLKFVGNSKILSLYIKKIKMLLQKTHNLLYNKTENKKRKNVKNVARKKKIR
jgi:spore cortex biosynthesis protein YabQ